MRFLVCNYLDGKDGLDGTRVGGGMEGLALAGAGTGAPTLAI